jgi:hypothetical protein
VTSRSEAAEAYSFIVDHGFMGVADRPQFESFIRHGANAGRVFALGRRVSIG